MVLAEEKRKERKKMEGSGKLGSDYHEEWQIAFSCIPFTEAYL
jgi:hypothetical protein